VLFFEKTGDERDNERRESKKGRGKIKDGLDPGKKYL